MESIEQPSEKCPLDHIKPFLARLATETRNAEPEEIPQIALPIWREATAHLLRQIPQLASNAAERFLTLSLEDQNVVAMIFTNQTFENFLQLVQQAHRESIAPPSSGDSTQPPEERCACGQRSRTECEDPHDG